MLHRRAFLAMANEMVAPCVCHCSLQACMVTFKNSDQQTGYLRWLFTRKVRVRALNIHSLAGWQEAIPNAFILPYIQHVSMEMARTDHVEDLLRACLDITEINWRAPCSCCMSAVTCLPSNPDTIWGILKRMSHVNLTSLKVADHGRGEHEVCEVLKLFGDKLTVLALEKESEYVLTKKIFHVLTHSCKELQDISITVHGVTMGRILQLLSACGKIKKLCLEEFQDSPPDIYHLLQSCPQLEVLIVYTKWNMNVIGEVLACVYNKFKHIELLQLEPDCSFKRESDSLRLIVCADLTVNTLDRMSHVFRTVKKLMICIKKLVRHLLYKIGHAWGETVEELTFVLKNGCDFADAHMFDVASHCPALRTLKTYENGEIVPLDDMLELKTRLAETCPRLVL